MPAIQCAYGDFPAVHQITYGKPAKYVQYVCETHRTWQAAKDTTVTADKTYPGTWTIPSTGKTGTLIWLISLQALVFRHTPANTVVDVIIIKGIQSRVSDQITSGIGTVTPTTTVALQAYFQSRGVLVPVGWPV